MKNMLLTTIAFLAFTIVSAQVTSIDLTQTVGAFTTESLELAAGEYQFTIHNQDVGHQVGFVLAPKGQYEAKDHIKTAYVKAPVATGESSMTGVVDLAVGEYEYFCPMNPTEKYPLTVREEVETIQLTQVPGAFKVQALTVTEGAYQFEIANNGIEQAVGFVLVPKGQYAPENHIKAAYVKAPVSTDASEFTNVVDLQAGEYEYFCPLNPTPKYSLTVVK
ncbi:MAG: plastocyanin/azurin family copper-binding protein [Bacteroidota bacterium]